MKLADRVTIITGGGRGIGKGISTRFAAEGAKVIIAQRDDTSANLAMREIIASGDKALFVKTDLAQPSSIDNLINQVHAYFGRIDILINNAGIAGLDGRFLEISLDRWSRVLEVNLTGAFLCAQGVARMMVKRKIQGAIINIGSLNSFIAQKCTVAYSTSKGGILQMTKAMAVDLAEYGIRVNCIAPGSIRVERNASYLDSDPIRMSLERGIPLGQPGMPGDVASAAIFLASDESSYITGACLNVDGGYTAYARID